MSQPAQRVDATPKRALLVAAALRERIVRRELPAGARLPLENELIDEFGASRFTVREALRILEVEGLVEIRRGNGGGPRVCEPPIAFAAQAMGVQLQLRAVHLDEVWQTRTELVIPAIRALAEQRTPELIASLSDLVARLADVADDVEAFPVVWVDITEQMVRLAGNDGRYVVVCALHEITERQLQAANQLSDPERATRFRAFVVESCRETLRRIAAGDAEGAIAEFERQSAAKSSAMNLVLGDLSVVDVFPWRHPGPDVVELDGRRMEPETA